MNGLFLKNIFKRIISTVNDLYIQKRKAPSHFCEEAF